MVVQFAVSGNTGAKDGMCATKVAYVPVFGNIVANARVKREWLKPWSAIGVGGTSVGATEGSFVTAYEPVGTNCAIVGHTCTVALFRARLCFSR